ncbi:MAG: hypothetical protein WCG27_05745 [Pseudomonadota bacterium]
MRLILILASFCCLFSSCTTIHYVSRGLVTVNVSDRAGLPHPFNVEGQRDFYMWGLYPVEHKVVVDQEIHSATHLARPSALSIEEYLSPSNMLFTFITLGMYCPRNYRLTGKGIRIEND